MSFHDFVNLRQMCPSNGWKERVRQMIRITERKNVIPNDGPPDPVKLGGPAKMQLPMVVVNISRAIFKPAVK